MKSNDRCTAFSIAVPPQVELARTRGLPAGTVALPKCTLDRLVADLGAFTEWNGELDRAYDVLADEAP